MSINIAIDGPAGAGKSTIAKRVAGKLGYIYIDTGAMYRAMGLYFSRKGIAPENEAAIRKQVKEADISIVYQEGAQQVLLNGENVTAYLRTEEAGNMASATSGYPCVREKLVELQRKLAAAENVVMDGRDIGTVVLPQADVKIFLTASAEVRAQRRYAELISKGETVTLDKVLADMRQRDKQDSTRAIAPLRCAEDAVRLDTSEMSLDEAEAAILKIVRGKLG